MLVHVDTTARNHTTQMLLKTVAEIYKVSTSELISILEFGYVNNQCLCFHSMPVCGREVKQNNNNQRNINTGFRSKTRLENICEKIV